MQMSQSRGLNLALGKCDVAEVALTWRRCVYHGRARTHTHEHARTMKERFTEAELTYAAKKKKKT